MKSILNDSDRSMEFISFYTFKCHQGDEIRLKHYAGILVNEFWADLIYNMDTGKGGDVPTGPLTLSTHSGGGKDGKARPVGISRFISNISGFISSYTAMELK